MSQQEVREEVREPSCGEMPGEVQKKRGRDLTEGPIGKQIILFTLPLLLGNLFQQFYNSADAVIVGKFVGKNALAAVGNSASIINLMVSLLMGVSMGAGVVISRYFGAKRYEEMRQTIHTAICFGAIAGVILTVVGVGLTPYVLVWMQTPETVMTESATYFRIYFCGSAFSVLYNMGSGIFRALGDSKRPLYFLIVSTLINLTLDLLFVAVLGMGIGGAALATIIAQAISMSLVYWKLMTDDAVYRVRFRELCIHGKHLRQIVSIGLPSGIQNSVVSLSNVVVQSNINIFGDIAMAGCGAYFRLDGFALLPSGSFSMALSTFVSQNLGAKQYDRAKRGSLVGLACTMLVSEAAGILISAFAPQLIAIFNTDPEVVGYGVLMARSIAPLYCLVAFSHGMAGVLRGAGLSRVPMFVMMGCWCVFRVIWIQTTVSLFHDIRTVFWAYPVTWIMSVTILTVYYLKVDWLHKEKLE